MKINTISNLILLFVLMLSGCTSTKVHQTKLINNGMLTGTPIVKEIIYKTKTEQIRPTGNAKFPKMYYDGRETVVFAVRDTTLFWRKFFGHLRPKAVGPFIVSVETVVRGADRWRVFNIETGKKLCDGVKVDGKPKIITSPQKTKYFVETRSRDKKNYYTLQGRKIGDITGGDPKFISENMVESTFCTKRGSGKQQTSLCTIIKLNLSTGQKISRIEWSDPTMTSK